MTRWLDANEQRHWRAWVAASTLLRERLSQELQAEHGIVLGDYEILVRLSEAPNRSLRMSALADHTLASRSRLSHQVDRLENLLDVASQVTDTMDQATAATVRVLSSPVIKTAAIARGTRKAARRLKSAEGT